MKMQEIESFIVRKLPIDSGKKNVLNRRINKLKIDPRGFLKNSYRKRSEMIKSNLPIKYNSVRNYTIVTAVYNSEKYLEDYFKSITNQSLIFKKNIKIICVDDGSTDKTPDIIKKWQKKFPENIFYLYKENGGQASARNLGLKSVNQQTDWITFIDSDDFLSRNYFYEVDKSIEKDLDIKMICCNQIYYFEEDNRYIDRHPFNYRFKDSNNIVSCRDMKSNIQFSAALSFFHFDSIPDNLDFDERMKPTFEDGKFVNNFLLSQKPNSLVYFNPNAKYFNRKRADKSSTMDSVWLHKGQYSTVLENGYLEILSQCYKEFGYIPRHLQRSILWEMLRLVKHLLNHEERVSFLTVAEKEKLVYLMEKCFKYIDKDTIMSYELGNCGFSRQLGMLGTFKGMDVDRQVVYIDKVDFNKNIFSLRFFACFDVIFNVHVGGKEIYPVSYKKSIRDFLSKIFLVEHRLWYPIPNNGDLTVEINFKNAFINFRGKKYKKGLPISNFNRNPRIEKVAPVWVFMDRDDRAGDNAEFLYDFVQNNYKNMEIYFVVDRSSMDWGRLNDKDFNLIEHGSESHRKVLERCSLLISSQCGYIIEPFKSLKSNYKRVFLQHGVIKDNLSNWLNNIKTDLMITSTKDEYQSIVADYTQYVLSKHEVKLTGLPRFDSLHKNRKSYSNNILIMFTWRKEIAGNFVNNEKSIRSFNENFQETYYCKTINSLVNSRELEFFSKAYGIKFTVCPHPNMDPYLRFFDIPDYMAVASSNDSIHKLINDSAIVITDYSSIAFDFAYQNKAVLYYQFDESIFFNGEHTYLPGYFDYKRDGFGPVVTKESDLLVELENVLKNDGKPLEPYKTRMIETFPFRDGKNCERVYEAIIDLDRPDTPEVSVDTIMEHAQQAITHGAWDLALERIENALQHSDITQAQVKEITQIKESVLQTGYQNEPVKLSNILWQEGRVEEALDVLKQIDDIEASEELLRLRVKLAILNNDFVLARDSQKLLLENYNEQCTTEDWQFYTQLASI